MLFKYLTAGRDGPLKSVAKDADPDCDLAGAFDDSGHWRDVLGILDCPQLRRNSEKTLKSAERGFKTMFANQVRTLGSKS